MSSCDKCRKVKSIKIYTGTKCLCDVCYRKDQNAVAKLIKRLPDVTPVEPLLNFRYYAVQGLGMVQ